MAANAACERAVSTGRYRGWTVIGRFEQQAAPSPTVLCSVSPHDPSSATPAVVGYGETPAAPVVIQLTVAVATGKVLKTERLE